MSPMICPRRAACPSMNELLLFASFLPLAALLAYDPESFRLAWNEGRGGLIFVAFFALFEWILEDRALRKRPSERGLLAYVGLLSSISAFYVARYSLGLGELLASAAEGYGIPGILNWIWMWEYIAFSLYLMGVISALFGSRALRRLCAGPIYGIGMASILFLDALFPYESIGPLHSMALLIVRIVVALAPLAGIKVIDFPSMTIPRPSLRYSGNSLWVWGKNGFIILGINWPCVGVLSMLIYSLIISLLMIKLDAPLRRKLIYAAFGAIGTFAINIFRIFAIVYYTAFISIDIKIFHELIGEALFLAWVLAFLIIIVAVENRIARVGAGASPSRSVSRIIPFSCKM
ncbi:MAG: exosortase/archaeosortase family protein [Candidatus Bathyarchaeia archaeon]